MEIEEILSAGEAPPYPTLRTMSAVTLCHSATNKRKHALRLLLLGVELARVATITPGAAVKAAVQGVRSAEGNKARVRPESCRRALDERAVEEAEEGAAAVIWSPEDWAAEAEGR